MPHLDITEKLPQEESERRTRYLLRGSTSIMTACGFESLGQLYENVWQWWFGWEKHPDYKPPKTPWHIFDVYAVGVWQHEPGRDGLTESYVFGDTADILASKKWGDRSYGGNFSIQPIMVGDPGPHWCRIQTMRNSYKGSGGAIESRYRMRKMMPKDVKPWIQKCRSFNADAKWLLCDCKEIRENEGWMRSKGRFKHLPGCHGIPKWTFVERRVPPHIMMQINRYMTFENFWKCCTGQVHPDKILDHLHPCHGRQLKLL